MSAEKQARLLQTELSKALDLDHPDLLVIDEALEHKLQRTVDLATSSARALSRNLHRDSERAADLTTRLGLGWCKAETLESVVADSRDLYRALGRSRQRSATIERYLETATALGMARRGGGSLYKQRYVISAARTQVLKLAAAAEGALLLIDTSAAVSPWETVIPAMRSAPPGQAYDAAVRQSRVSGVLTLAVVGIAVRLLPPAHRARYEEEFSAELADLPRRARWIYAMRQLSRAPATRSFLHDGATAPSEWGELE